MKTGIAHNPRLEPCKRRRPRPLSLAERVVTLLLWVGAHVPSVVSSGAIVLPIVGLLPGLIAWLVLGAMVVGSLLLATRWMRWPAVGWLLGGTRLPADVGAAIRPLLEVAACVSDGRRIDLGLAAPGVQTTAVGPNIILLDRALVDGYCAGKVDSHFLAFTLAHEAAQLRLGYTRLDLVVTFWCLPMILIKAIGTRLGKNSLIAAAWRARFLMAGVVLVHSYLDATLPLGIAGAGIIAGTYAIPWLRRVWTRHLENVAETALRLALAESATAELPILGTRRRPIVWVHTRRRARRRHLGWVDSVGLVPRPATNPAGDAVADKALFVPSSWSRTTRREFEMSRSTSEAYGHLRNAAWHYLSADGDGGEGVLLGAACLDVEDAFEKAEVVPELVQDEGSAEAAIKAALESLGNGDGPLVPALREALVELAGRAGLR